MGELRTGQVLSVYELVRKLGEGAFGEVWLARHLDWNTEFALKIPTDPQYIDQLRREGALVFSLSHPNIVDIQQSDTRHDPPYLAMEYVEGGDLRARLEREGKLPLNAALAILSQVLDALEAAHARGVVHRDLKPGNILLTADGTVKVSDFGLGRLQAAIACSLSMSGSLFTQQGKSISGTLAYMSPEQGEGEDATPSDDLYAVGIIGCELLTGRRPAAAGAAKHLTRAGVAAPVVAVLDKACDTRQYRYQSAAGMRAALHEARRACAAGEARPHARAPQPPAQPIPPRPVPRLPPPPPPTAHLARAPAYDAAGALDDASWAADEVRHVPSRRSGLGILAWVFVIGVGLVGVAFLTQMSGLLRAREQARRIRCRDMLNQLAKGMATYLNEFGGNRFYPCPLGRTRAPKNYNGAEWLAGLYWTGVVPDPAVFLCPSTSDTNAEGKHIGAAREAPQFGSQTVSYAGMHYFSLTDRTGEPFGAAIRDDFPPNDAMASDDTQGAINHGEKNNSGMSVLFFDSHVEFGTNTEVDLETGVGATAPPGQPKPLLWRLRN